MKNEKVYYFDGTMLIVAMNDSKQKINALAFTQTDIKREIGKECKDVKIDPDLFFVFESKKSIDSLISMCELLKEKFIENMENDK